MATPSAAIPEIDASRAIETYRYTLGDIRVDSLQLAPASIRITDVPVFRMLGLGDHPAVITSARSCALAHIGRPSDIAGSAAEGAQGLRAVFGDETRDHWPAQVLMQDQSNTCPLPTFSKREERLVLRYCPLGWRRLWGRAKISPG